MDMTPKALATKQNKLVGRHQTEKLLNNKEDVQQSKKAIYGMGDNMSKPYI